MLVDSLYTNLSFGKEYYVRNGNRIYKCRLDAITVDSRADEVSKCLIGLEFKITKSNVPTRNEPLILYGCLKIGTDLMNFEDSDLYEKATIYKNLDSCIRDKEMNLTLDKMCISATHYSNLYPLYSIVSNWNGVHITNGLVTKVAYKATLDGIVTRSLNPRLRITSSVSVKYEDDPLKEGETLNYEGALIDLENMIFNRE